MSASLVTSTTICGVLPEPPARAAGATGAESVRPVPTGSAATGKSPIPQEQVASSRAPATTTEMAVRMMTRDPADPAGSPAEVQCRARPVHCPTGGGIRHRVTAASVARPVTCG
ncbi:hypothetical protein GCM10011512_22900 [Tersicoccus solisilvae]|uniref:Uncharacterized protein n=1 Tax=Tersicoccus solisilvae TaxID=1882339 RepID=A0ABQ1PDY2_9MICC|nr:hypothetical protein GCM10011512_22900 [Tersicoccus solisilvae]